MAEVIVSAVVNPVFKHSANAVVRQFKYLWNYKKNMDNLEKQVTTLESKIIDMNHSVNVAIRNAEEIGDQVGKWLSEARDISGQARNFLEEYKGRGKMRCLVGLCPNLASRHQFSRRACKIVIDMARVITKEGQIREVSFRVVGHERAILSTKGFFTFDSRKPILENIMKALQAEIKSPVGVYGFGGMGKTTLAKQVASQAKEEKLFEEIVLASVTQKVDMKEMQGQIASMLDLKLEEFTVAERASRIHHRLKGKKVLVILDDLWKDLDLNEVGIPFGPEHMGCKILLTSRFRHVLTSMGTGKDFNLGALDEEEAWRLFEEKVGGSVLKNSEFHNIGTEVAKRCQGLPVLIVTVAASLSKRPELSAWNDALNQLKKMNHKEMHDIVNSAMESISYNHLEKTHKQLFLLCGVIGGVASIEEVLQYSWGLDLFDEEAVTIQKARDRLYTLILDLKESCLLLDDVDESNSIKMHDVVRDVAISIGKKYFNMYTMGEHGAELNIWHKDVDLKMCTAMVLRGFPTLPCLPQLLECPSLELFVMSGFSNVSSPSISDSFFEKANKIKVLGMSRLSFSALPSSLSFLKNLQALRVNDCDSLEDVAIVGELKKLQTLSFACSRIEVLPSGIGKLSELRLLDVRRCHTLKVIPAGLIKGLSQLEELYVSQNFKRWEADECVNGIVKTNASLLELKHLHNLCILEIRVRDDKLLLEDLHFEKLERYEIIVGDMWKGYNWRWFDEIEVTRTFCLQLSTTSNNHLQSIVERLFKNTECLCLGEVKGIKNVTPALDGDGFPNLKHLEIRTDYEIQYIVNAEDKQRNALFPSLESLYLTHMLKLQKIYNGPLMKESFCKLTTVVARNCDVLESLFSCSMTTGLPRLQEIKVYNCNALEEIVGEKNINAGVCENIEFAQLRKLFLICLPKLKNFFSNDEMLSLQNKSQKSLRTDVETHTEEELQSSLPFFRKVSFPKLEVLIVSEISNLTKIWSHKVAENYCNLTRLEITKCNNLKYLLTPSVAMGFVGLQHLTVENCVRMKHLVAGEDGETNIETISFSQLSSLCLKNLPSFTKFYSGSGEDMGSNENLDTAAPPLFNEKVSFPKLENLDMSGISNLTEIWSHKLQVMPCRDLTSLTICKCKNLKHVFPAFVAPSLNKLEYLHIENCKAVETVIGDENGEEPHEEIIKPTQHAAATFIFTKLAEVYLVRLPKVKCFYTREHIIECPTLMDINVVDCGKLHAFDFLNFPQKQGDNQFEKVMSNMKNMTIRSVDLMKILRLYDHFPPHLFSSLERLDIVEFQGGSVVFPSKFLSIIYNQLQTFRVYDCSFQEIFPYEEVTNHTNDNILLPQLTDLRLEKLPELKYICKHDQYSPFILNILDKLEDIRVTECPRLTNLVPPSVSFRSIEYLTVKDCGGMRNLMHPSTATSLEQLWRLRISGCDMMATIIGDDDYEEPSRDDEIIFTNLWCLELEKLPRLANFCSSPNYTFNFPKLSDLIVKECPNIKTFCGGITVAPLLNKVKYEGEERWEGDINTTVQQIFIEMEAKRLTALPSASSSNHVEVKARVHKNSSKELIELMPMESGDWKMQLLPDSRPRIVKKIMKTLKRHLPFSGQEGLLELKKIAVRFEEKVYSEATSQSDYLREISLKMLSMESAKAQEPTRPIIECENDVTNAEKTVDTFEEGKRKESVVSEEATEHFKTSEETPFHLVLPSSPASQHVVASSPHPISPVTNHPSETSPSLATEVEAKRLVTSLSSTSSESGNSIESRKGSEKVVEERKSGICVKATAYEKGKGKELEVSEITSHPLTNNYTTQEQTVPMSVASSSKSSSQYEEFQRLFPSTSSNNQEAEIHEKETEPTKEHQMCKHVADEISEGDTFTGFCEELVEGGGKQVRIYPQHVVPSSSRLSSPISSSNNNFEVEAQLHYKSSKKVSDEPIVEGQVRENAAEKPAKLEVPQNSAEAEELTNAEKTADTFEEGKGKEHFKTCVETPCPLVPSSHNYTAKEQTITSSLASQYVVASSKETTELEVRRSTPTVESEPTDPRKACGILNHSETESPARTSSSIHFIPLLSEFLQIIQNQPLKSMSAEHVQFMENAFRALSDMNFSIEWFNPYVQKARECVPVLESRIEISELESEIAKMEAELEAVKDKKKALEEKYEGVASRIDLDKSLHHS